MGGYYAYQKGYYAGMLAPPPEEELEEEPAPAPAPQPYGYGPASGGYSQSAPAPLPQEAPPPRESPPPAVYGDPVLSSYGMAPASDPGRVDQAPSQQAPPPRRYEPYRPMGDAANAASIPPPDSDPNVMANWYYGGYDEGEKAAMAADTYAPPSHDYQSPTGGRAGYGSGSPVPMPAPPPTQEQQFNQAQAQLNVMGGDPGYYGAPAGQRTITGRGRPSVTGLPGFGANAPRTGSGDPRSVPVATPGAGVVERPPRAGMLDLAFEYDREAVAEEQRRRETDRWRAATPAPLGDVSAVAAAGQLPRRDARPSTPGVMTPGAATAVGATPVSGDDLARQAAAIRTNQGAMQGGLPPPTSASGRGTGTPQTAIGPTPTATDRAMQFTRQAQPGSEVAAARAVMEASPDQQLPHVEMAKLAGQGLSSLGSTLAHPDTPFLGGPLSAIGGAADAWNRMTPEERVQAVGGAVEGVYTAPQQAAGLVGGVVDSGAGQAAGAEFGRVWHETYDMLAGADPSQTGAKMPNPMAAIGATMLASYATYDLGRQKEVEALGETLYKIATGQPIEPWEYALLTAGAASDVVTIPFVQDDAGKLLVPGTILTDEMKARVIAWHDQGFQRGAPVEPHPLTGIPTATGDPGPAFAGGRAVWEGYQDYLSQELGDEFIAGLVRGIRDVPVDPTAALAAAAPAGGLVRAGGSALRAGESATGVGRVARNAAGVAMEATGSALMAPQAVMDVTVDAPFTLASKLGRRAGWQGPVGQQAADVVATGTNEAARAVITARRAADAAGQAPPGSTPGTTGGAAPTPAAAGPSPNGTGPVAAQPQPVPAPPVGSSVTTANGLAATPIPRTRVVGPQPRVSQSPTPPYPAPQAARTQSPTPDYDSPNRPTPAPAPGSAASPTPPQPTGGLADGALSNGRGGVDTPMADPSVRTDATNPITGREGAAPGSTSASGRTVVRQEGDLLLTQDANGHYWVEDTVTGAFDGPLASHRAEQRMEMNRGNAAAKRVGPIPPADPAARDARAQEALEIEPRGEAGWRQRREADMEMAIRDGVVRVGTLEGPIARPNATTGRPDQAAMAVGEMALWERWLDDAGYAIDGWEWVPQEPGVRPDGTYGLNSTDSGEWRAKIRRKGDPSFGTAETAPTGTAPGRQQVAEQPMARAASQRAASTTIPPSRQAAPAFRPAASEKQVIWAKVNDQPVVVRGRPGEWIATRVRNGKVDLIPATGDGNPLRDVDIKDVGLAEYNRVPQTPRAAQPTPAARPVDAAQRGLAPPAATGRVTPEQLMAQPQAGGGRLNKRNAELLANRRNREAGRSFNIKPNKAHQQQVLDPDTGQVRYPTRAEMEHALNEMRDAPPAAYGERFVEGDDSAKGHFGKWRQAGYQSGYLHQFPVEEPELPIGAQVLDQEGMPQTTRDIEIKINPDGEPGERTYRVVNKETNQIVATGFPTKEDARVFAERSVKRQGYDRFVQEMAERIVRQDPTEIDAAFRVALQEKTGNGKGQFADTIEDAYVNAGDVARQQGRPPPAPSDDLLRQMDEARTPEHIQQTWGRRSTAAPEGAQRAAGTPASAVAPSAGPAPEAPVSRAVPAEAASAYTDDDVFWMSEAWRNDPVGTEADLRARRNRLPEEDRPAFDDMVMDAIARAEEQRGPGQAFDPSTGYNRRATRQARVGAGVRGAVAPEKAGTGMPIQENGYNPNLVTSRHDPTKPGGFSIGDPVLVTKGKPDGTFWEEEPGTVVGHHATQSVKVALRDGEVTTALADKKGGRSPIQAEIDMSRVSDASTAPVNGRTSLVPGEEGPKPTRPDVLGERLARGRPAENTLDVPEHYDPRPDLDDADAPTPEEIEVAQVLRRRLDEQGLGDLELNLTWSVQQGARGSYERIGAQQRININRRILTDVAEGRKTLDHEVVHALRDLGVIRDDEWDALVALSRRARHPVSGRTMRNEMARAMKGTPQERAYGAGPVADEEAVAETYAIFRRSPERFAAPERSILDRIGRFLQAIVDTFRGRPNVDPVKVMRAIAEGQVARRPSPGFQGYYGSGLVYDAVPTRRSTTERLATEPVNGRAGAVSGEEGPATRSSINDRIARGKKTSPWDAPYDEGYAEIIIAEARRKGRAVSDGIALLDDAQRAEADRIAFELRERLDAMGLRDVPVVVASVLESLVPGTRMSGAIWSRNRRWIGVRFDNPDVMRQALDHEAGHAARDMGLLTDDEWRLALDEIGRATNPDTGRSFLDIDQRYKDPGSEYYVGDLAEGFEHEAFAEAFRHWRQDPILFPPATRSMFQRIADVFQAIVDTLRGRPRAPQSAHDVFSRISSGEVGARPRAATLPASGERSALRRPVPTTERLATEDPRWGDPAQGAVRAATGAMRRPTFPTGDAGQRLGNIVLPGETDTALARRFGANNPGAVPPEFRGKTILDVVVETRDDLARGREIRAMFALDPNLAKNKALQKEMAGLIQKWRGRGFGTEADFANVTNQTIDEMAIKRVHEGLSAEMYPRKGIVGRIGGGIGTGFDELSAELRDLTLHNTLTGYRYVMLNAVGNTLTMALLGRHPGLALRAVSPDNVLRNFRALRKEGVTPAMAEWADRHAQPTSARNVMNVGAGGQYGTGRGLGTPQPAPSGGKFATGSDTATASRRWISQRQNPLGRQLATALRNVGSLPLWRDLAAAIDLGFREAHFVDTALRAERRAAHVFRRQARTAATDASLPASVTDGLGAALDRAFLDADGRFGGATGDAVRQELKKLDPGNLPTDVKQKFDGWVTHQSRAWAEAENRVQQLAQKDMEKFWFTGKSTNADEVLRKLGSFHYWSTRWFKLAATESLANPYLGAAIGRMIEGVRQMSDRDDLPPYLAGWLKTFEFMGEDILTKPYAALQAFLMMDDQLFYQPSMKGATGYGKAVKEFPLMMNHLLAGASWWAGLMGDVSKPNWFAVKPQLDLFALGVRAAAEVKPDWISADWLRDAESHLVMTPDDWWTMKSAQVRQRVATQMGEWIPWGNLGKIHDDPMTNRTDRFRDDVGSIVLERYSDENWNAETQAEYDAWVETLKLPPGSAPPARADFIQARAFTAMHDRTDPIFAEAEDREFKRMLFEEASQATSPVPAIVGPNQKVEKIAGAVEQAYAEKRPVDTEGAAAYDIDKFQDLVHIEAANIKTLDDVYKTIGGAYEQKIDRSYQWIVHGETTKPIVVDGITFTPEDLRAMDYNERYRIADRWTETMGVGQLYRDFKAHREMFLDAHPELRARYSLDDIAYAYGSPDGARPKDQAAANANADKWIEDTAATNEAFAAHVAGVKEYRERQEAAGIAWDDAKERSYILGVNGYLAIQGYAGKTWLPTPPASNQQVAGGQAFDAAVAANPHGGPGRTIGHVTEDVAQYREAQDILRAAGVDPSVIGNTRFGELPEEARDAILAGAKRATGYPEIDEATRKAAWNQAIDEKYGEGVWVDLTDEDFAELAPRVNEILGTTADEERMWDWINKRIYLSDVSQGYVRSGVKTPEEWFASPRYDEWKRTNVERPLDPTDYEATGGSSSGTPAPAPRPYGVRAGPSTVTALPASTTPAPAPASRPVPRAYGPGATTPRPAPAPVPITNAVPRSVAPATGRVPVETVWFDGSGQSVPLVDGSGAPATPNYGYPSDKPDGTRALPARFIVMHYTAGDMDEFMGEFMGDTQRASSNYVVDRDGSVYMVVPPDYSAWNHGDVDTPHPDATPGYNFNQEAIGIEIVNAGCSVHGDASTCEPYTDAQVAALEQLTAQLAAQYGIAPDHVIGHEDVTSGKGDPGPLFPWDRIRGAVGAPVSYAAD